MKPPLLVEGLGLRGVNMNVQLSVTLASSGFCIAISLFREM